MRLPLLLSVPHAGLDVPPEVAPRHLLSPQDIAADGDVGAREIYDLGDHVRRFVTSEVARAFVDFNRREDDRSKDGVVKTHTCWDVPVYAEPLPESVVEQLLQRYHRPYHQELSQEDPAVLLGVDCHTMAAVAPPVAPDVGCQRPLVCLSDGGGACPGPWIEALRECFVRHFDGEVTINRPFQGGPITRRHGRERPWVQLELSRAEEVMDRAGKRAAVLAALTDWCRRMETDPIPPG